jgi:hypothetical protein
MSLALKLLKIFNPETAHNLGLLLPVQTEKEYDPMHWEKYGYNPFSRIDK